MAIAATVKKDSYGATWSVSTGIDLTNATEVGVNIEDENGTTTEYEGAAQSPATGGVILWTDTSGVWDGVGFYRLEAYATFSSALRYGDAVLIKVEDSL